AEDYSYFFNGVKHILKPKENTLSGIHGAVAEVIKVPSKLTQAIETALGASLQHIIVNNEKDGRQAIKFLKQRGLGRATFLPLNVIRARSLSHHIQNIARNFDGFINIASEAVEVNKTYQAVIDNLMGTTIIVENLKIANELARAIQYKARIVTLEGDIVNPGGAMTGGGMRQSKSILAQKDELATMKIQLNDYEEKTKEFEQQLQKQKEKVETLSNKYVELSQQYHQLKDTAHEETLTLDRLKKQETHIKSEHEEFEFEKNDGYQSEKSRHTLKQQQLRLSEIQEQLKQLENDIEVYSKLSKEGKENVSQVEKELNQKRSDVAVVKEKISHQIMSLERIDKQLAQINQQIIATKEKIELFNSDDMMGEKAFQQLQSSIQDKASQRDKLKQKLDTLKEQKDSINEDIEIHEYKLEQCHQDLLSIESFYQDIKAQQSKLDVLINHAMNHLNETYHLTLERARETYQSDVSIETLRKKVKLTKMSIEELGSVNVNAIEQFEELNERYTFLNEQRNDLREAKQTLEQIINEMDQEVKDRFKATFFEVQDYFTTVFQSLFGGGHAKLELTDDDYLSAGVDIIVQPPGKKLQNLSLLSGGERALSAIALLFAILKVRSAPFVILDEVEAALDEANVIRYAQFLNDL
ncbi:MAG: chromosome segregation SMC family protein, partial [Staphylococcus sp.]|nr:chromosome segregation SMC family protein [Staphylococcus sp.]